MSHLIEPMRFLVTPPMRGFPFPSGLLFTFEIGKSVFIIVVKMSLDKMFAGRRRESSVWKYFEYNEQTRKSKCCVTDAKIGKECGALLAGKNCSNLISHLARIHKDVHTEFEETEKARNEDKRGTKRHAPDIAPGPSSKVQSLEQCIQRKPVMWPKDSAEYKRRSAAVMDMLITTGYPVTLVDKPSFRYMLTTMDPKFAPPGSAKLGRLMSEQFEAKSLKLKEILSTARKVTLCLDAWTKKGLSASFLGVSACFFDPSTATPVHVILNLYELQHPHTGTMIADCLEKSIEQWGITKEKVQLIVSDNGSNMVKAVKVMREHEADRKQADEEPDEEEETSEGENSAEDEEPTDEDDAPLVLPPHVEYRWMPCMAHTLQLIIKPAYVYFSSLLEKTRHLVGKIRKSSVAVEKVVEKCGKSVVSDCNTRWNSSFLMLNRLVDIKSGINEVLTELGIDTLLISEWQRLTDIINLLRPFAQQTDLLQTDAVSMSNIVPSILDLECHLQQHPTDKQLTSSMLRDMRRRFEAIMQPDCELFNPLPAAACLLDPTVATVLLAPEYTSLFVAAKSYIVSLGGESVASIPHQSVQSQPAGLRRFTFLAAKISASNATATFDTNQDTVLGQLNRHVADVRDYCDTTGLQYWTQRQDIFSQLAHIAQDLLSAPASQAYVERIFSLCGILTAGRRNRQKQSLEMRVFLKLNNNI